VSRADWELLLVATLNTPGTLAALERHSRAYGGATRKLEPRELEQVELPPLHRLAVAAVRRLAGRAARWLDEPDRERRRTATARWELELLRELPGDGLREPPDAPTVAPACDAPNAGPAAPRGGGKRGGG
jgi:hypothetical protein